MTQAACLMMNLDGKLVSAETTLNIVDAFAPLLDKSTTSDVNFQVGEFYDNPTITCPISGGPPPEYKWFYDKKNIELLQGINTSTLTFRHIRESLTGNYICEARNQYGVESFEFHVNIQPQGHPNKLDGSTIGWITAGVVLCIILACAVAVLTYKCLKAKREIRNLTPEEALEFLNGVPMSEGAEFGDGSELALHLPFTKRIESDRLTLSRDTILGKGQYGIVYRGTLNAEAVAVKTFKSAVTVDEFRASLVEVKLMAFVDEHPNVVKFIGADVTNIEKRDIFIIMELSPIGSLEKHLRMLKPAADTNYVNTTSQCATDDHALVYRTLFGFCEQIAYAMEHLENKRVIHGDLAARNVLVFSQDIVKVTDFGYSRQLYEDSMYKPKTTRALPWRWASIELLRRMEFSTGSDVWAFGVTVWEIFTFGNVPFASEKWNEQFMDSLENGFRLSKPAGLSETQYSFITNCWNVDKSGRPRFSVLKCFFSTEKEKHCHDVEAAQV